MQKESLNRNYEIYCKQLEDANENLKQKLSDAETVIDSYNDIPELEHITTSLIRNVLQYQKKYSPKEATIRSHRSVVMEFMTVKLALPRHIGQSTCIIKSALKFFNHIHIGVPWTRGSPEKSDPRITYHYLANMQNFRGIRYLECLIIDPWDDEIMKKIDYGYVTSLINPTHPGLIIQVGQVR